jgi:TPR repeat protein
MRPSIRHYLIALVILVALSCVSANAQRAATDPLGRERNLAEQGSDIFQTRLGVRYWSGDGVEKNYDEAVKWFRLAADQGNPHAATLLASLYSSGLGVPEDPVQAYMWYDIAISRMVENDKSRELTAKARDSLGKMMTAAQIKESKRLAAEWKPVAKPKFERRMLRNYRNCAQSRFPQLSIMSAAMLVGGDFFARNHCA